MKIKLGDNYTNIDPAVISDDKKLKIKKYRFGLWGYFATIERHRANEYRDGYWIIHIEKDDILVYMSDIPFEQTTRLKDVTQKCCDEIRKRFLDRPFEGDPHNEFTRQVTDHIYTLIQTYRIIQEGLK